jgi:hypothetical protein
LFQKTLTQVPFAACIGLTWSSQNRPYSVNQITKNIELISAHNDIQIDKSSSLRLTYPKLGENNTPLVVMLSWLMAKRKHILKYANFYMDQGFDVLSVSITPWQLLWPMKGTQVRKIILKFTDIYIHCHHQSTQSTLPNPHEKVVAVLTNDVSARWPFAHMRKLTGYFLTS